MKSTQDRDFWIALVAISIYDAQIIIEYPSPNKVITKTRIESRFLKGLVPAITFQVYAPAHISVTRAKRSDMSSYESNEKEEVMSKNSGDQTSIEAIQKTLDNAIKVKQPIYMRFE